MIDVSIGKLIGREQKKNKAESSEQRVSMRSIDDGYCDG